MKLTEANIFRVCYWIFMPMAVFMFLYGFNNLIIWKWGFWSEDWIITFIIIGLLMGWLLSMRIRKIEETLKDTDASLGGKK